MGVSESDSAGGARHPFVSALDTNASELPLAIALSLSELPDDRTETNFQATLPQEAIDLQLAAELSLLSEAPDDRTNMAPEAIPCFVCGVNTLNPLRLKDKECLHAACSLHCLQRLHSQWIDIKCDLLKLDASFP